MEEIKKATQEEHKKVLHLLFQDKRLQGEFIITTKYYSHYRILNMFDIYILRFAKKFVTLYFYHEGRLIGKFRRKPQQKKTIRKMMFRYIRKLKRKIENELQTGIQEARSDSGFSR